MKITDPGLYRDFDTTAYFSDPCPDPSLTQSIAKILLARSPLHAFHAHPRLWVPLSDDDEPEKYDKAKAIGNAAHLLMLDRGKKLAIGEFDSWRGKEPQAFKAEAIKNGYEPVLEKHYEGALEMVHEGSAQLAIMPECENAFRGLGDAEVVISSCEDGIWLRSMLDWITADLREIWDYKTIGRSASPYNTGKLMAADGWHIQAAFHERILDALDPKGAGRRRHLFVCQENESPYALTVNEISESAMTIGRKMVNYAFTSWAICLKRKVWPSYPMRIIRPELPTYAETSWLQREEDEDQLESLMGG